MLKISFSWLYPIWAGLENIIYDASALDNNGAEFYAFVYSELSGSTIYLGSHQ